MKGALARGTTLGRYVVLDVVGRGGMGVVYAAYDPELNRKVGLKLLRRLDGQRRGPASFEGRLLREAQALAKLRHPHVITVYDVGSFDGQIFIAMEYVEGGTLDDWLARQPWTNRQIVDVFLQAGNGLAAAHSAGLVHRDFKPRNVMVDRDGRVLVLDFSLARETVLEDPDDERVVELDPSDASPVTVSDSPFESPLTRTGAVMGTPAYMAPEQHVGEAAGPAADQFAFCATLYQALYQELPFETPKRYRSLAEHDWQVMDAPSGSRVPAWLRRILLKGLQVDPEDRHPSMKALLEALSNDPWERRRRLLAAAAVLLVVAGVFLGYRASLESKHLLCRGAEQKLVGTWDAERRQAISRVFAESGEAYAADVAAATQAALDEYAAAWVTMHTDACEATHLRGEQSLELLDLRMDCLDQSRQEVGALVGILERDASVRLDRAVEAVNALRPLSACGDTLALTSPVKPPPGDETLARVHEVRSRLAEAKAYQAAGDTDRGLEIATAAAAMAEELGYWPLTAEALLRLGVLKVYEAGSEEATATLLRALVAATAGGHERVAAETLIRLVWEVGYRQSDFEQALRYADQAKAVLERLSRSREQQWLLADHLGTVYFHQGDYEKALSQHLRALELKEATRGPAHLDVASTLLRLGNVAKARAEPLEALGYFDRALRINQRALGPRHPRVADALNNVGRAHFQLARYDRAREYHEQALKVTVDVLGAGHSDVAMTLMNLGTVDLTTGLYDQALERYRAALEILEGSFGAEDARVAMVRSNIALALNNQGEHRQAVETFKQVLETQEKLYGNDHPWVADTVFNLSVAFRALGDSATSYRHARRAVRIWEATMDEDHPRIAHGLTGMGEDLIDLGLPGDAIAPLERALEIRRALERDPTLVAETRFALAQALFEQDGDSRSRALELAERALEGFRKTSGKNTVHIAETEAWLAARQDH